MKGEHRKIPDTNISPLSILKTQSFLHPNSNKNIMTTHHRASQIPPHYDPTTNTSPSPQPPAIHTPFPIQPSKHIKSKTILQNKTVIKIDYQLLGKPPQIEYLFLLLIPDPQKSPPNKIVLPDNFITTINEIIQRSPPPPSGTKFRFEMSN